MLTSSVVDGGNELPAGQTEDYKIDICWLSWLSTLLRSKIKNWLAQDLVNVCKWSDMSIRRLLFQWASTIKIQLTPWRWKIPHLALNNNQSLKLEYYWKLLKVVLNTHIHRGRHGRDRDRMVVGFTTTCAISAYHH
jgi:hypothetical protein